MSNKKAVLTAVGKDRPGIVAEVSGVLYEMGCNLEGSSMCLLQGYFAMILMLSYPDSTDSECLRSRFQRLQDEMKLLIDLHPLETGIKAPPLAGRAYILNVIGMDHPGIVHRVTSFLASSKVNITDVNTRLISEESEPVYVMVLELDVPEEVDPEVLCGNLGNLAKELKVDISLNPIETFQG